MTNYDPANPSYDPANPSSQPYSLALRQILSNRFVVLAVIGGAIFLTARFNWGWLVAAGIAPLLLSAGPCLAMCALGLCMKGGTKSQADAQSAPGGSDSVSNLKPPQQLSALSDNAGLDVAYGISSSEGHSGVSSPANKPTTQSGRKGCC